MKDSTGFLEQAVNLAFRDIKKQLNKVTNNAHGNGVNVSVSQHECNQPSNPDAITFKKKKKGVPSQKLIT